MSEQIVIEGSVARRVRMEVLDETPLANLAPFLTTRLPTTLPILPQHPVRHAHFDPEAGTGYMLLETKPRRHIMQVQHNGGRFPRDAERRDDDGLSRFNVLLPYQYFASSFQINESGGSLRDFTIQRSFLFWAKQPLRDPTDRLYPARCPNVDSSGSICWGQTRSDSSSLSARLDDQVNNFFTTTFNEDLGHLTPFNTSLTEWEENSEDPLAYLEWDFWNDAPAISLEDIAAYLVDAPPTNIAELNPSFQATPALPQNFTVARAAEWLNSLSDGARRRILVAAAQRAEEPTEEVPA